MAGLGNIYVDEVLYRQGSSSSFGSKLTAREAKAVRKETIAVLAQAVEKGGSTIQLLQQCFWRRRHHAGRTPGLWKNRPAVFALRDAD